jgi:hypothetical protein
MCKIDFLSYKRDRDENLEKFRESRRRREYSPLEWGFTVIIKHTDHYFTMHQYPIYPSLHNSLFNERNIFINHCIKKNEF